MKLKPLDEQVVVLFGASSGIGREAAMQFAERGAKVVVAARRAAALESLAQDIRMRGGVCVPVVAEATDFAQVKQVADDAARRFGRIDTWVHLASVSIYAPFEQTEPEEFARVIEVNLVGAAYGAKAALPYLKESHGALIMISSVESVQAIPFHSAYAASKHGLRALTDVIRMELEAAGAEVSVTNIMPASINTPFFDVAKTRLGVKPRGVPPVYEPDVVARAVLYAAGHPVRDLAAGGAGKSLIFLKRLSPFLADKAMIAAGLTLQKTKEEKSADAPNNLFAPVEDGPVGPQGSFSKEARSWSLYTWWATTPAAQWAGRGLALAGLGALTMRALGNRKSAG
jgi:NAD(P)-dependent dehydrogenase (short-subunit alcohol dehydrogenase family)